jgi:hypothetical protein
MPMYEISSTGGPVPMSYSKPIIAGPMTEPMTRPMSQPHPVKKILNVPENVSLIDIYKKLNDIHESIQGLYNRLDEAETDPAAIIESILLDLKLELRHAIKEETKVLSEQMSEAFRKLALF